MHSVLVGLGLALAFIGYVLERREPGSFTRGKAVGLVLYVVGEILLFGEGWWWGLIGFAALPSMIDAVLSAIRGR